MFEERILTHGVKIASNIPEYFLINSAEKYWIVACSIVWG
jgi:hypothetical protein